MDLLYIATLLCMLVFVHGKKHTATCDITKDSGLSSQQIYGKVTFTYDDATKVTVITGDIYGFSTTDNVTYHGLHIHEFGKLGNNCTDAGAHFNPTAQNHGRQTDTTRHIGDLGNIEEKSGKAAININDNLVKLTGTNNVTDKALVVHEKPDDFSQPVGNAGGRLGCCIIKLEGTSSGEKVKLSLSLLTVVILAALPLR